MLLNEESKTNVEEIDFEENGRVFIPDEAPNETAIAEVNNFANLVAESQNNGKTKQEIITNIKDVKKLFNIDSGVDAILNDCVGQRIKVKEVLIKRYEKELQEPIINQETGEIKEFTTSMSVVLIDEDDISYATGSKIFGIQLMRYFTLLEKSGLLKNGNFEPFEIEIIKSKFGDSDHDALKFKLI